MTEADPYSPSRAIAGPPMLADFNDAGILDAADIHVAVRLGRLAGEADESVLLAVALTVCATRLGNVRLDLQTAAGLADALGVPAERQPPWPPTESWLCAVGASPLVGGPTPVLRLLGTCLYLDRYLRYEERLADNLTMRRAAVGGVDDEQLTQGLDRLFAAGEQVEADEQQRTAAQVAVRQHFSVIAGGPGTGKTTTVAKIMALICEQQGSGDRPLLIGLAAPTGRAAARLKESIDEQVPMMDVAPHVRLALGEAEALTLHRLLGWQPGNQSRFRHTADNPLPHDVVIVDESSMIPLVMMEQLVDAVSPSARLILMGDPRQLTSIDAGSAFADIVGPVVDADLDAGVVVLHKVHRFGGAIFDLAAAVLRGDVDRSIGLLVDGQAQGLDSPVQWIEADDGGPSPQANEHVLAALAPHWVALVDAAERGDGPAAFAELRNCRILCAHRDGRHGASFWNQLAFRSVAAVRAVGRDHNGWYPGRPLLIVENDYQLTVFNGDTGVIMASSDSGAAGSASSAPDAGPTAVFDRAIGPLRISPERLGPVQTAYASTVHKGQGSQFQQVLVVLPPPTSRVLSRELLYTAITRAQRKVIILASRESLAAAIERRTVRSSGLQQRLWPFQSPS